ncbi:MAG: hypothetical protein ACYDCO_28050 [Armatimonadota bacterium]
MGGLSGESRLAYALHARKEAQGGLTTKPMSTADARATLAALKQAALKNAEKKG